MKLLFICTTFIIKELTGARLNNMPSYAVPKLSDSYLPATMQVIFHAVEQLKRLYVESDEYTNILISSSPHPPGLTTWQIVSKTGKDMELTTPQYNENTTSSFTNKSLDIRFIDKKQQLKLGNKNEATSEEVKPLEKAINDLTYKFENPDVLRINLSGKKSASLQQLASLYDSLNKDVRAQGFIMYTGFSDEVIKTLSGSMKGGVGLQLKRLLEKTLECGELTKDNTKIQVKKTVNDLKDSKSYLSTDLRRLFPLRYIQ